MGRVVTGRAGSREYRQRLKDAKLELKKSQRKNYYKILEVAKVRPLAWSHAVRQDAGVLD